jgi:hypothetical protein
MARNKNKNLLLKAKKARADRLEASRLDIEAKIAIIDEEDEELFTDDIIAERTNLFNQLHAIRDEEDEFEDARRDRHVQKLKAKDEIRQAKLDAGLKVGKLKTRIQWTSGGRDLVPERSNKNATFFGAQEAGLAKVSRDIGRWETLVPYDNMRGVSKGDIVMIISEKYSVDVGHGRRKTKSKWAVDIMIGPHVVKGIPAAALRPLEED